MSVRAEQKAKLEQNTGTPLDQRWLMSSPTVLWNQPWRRGGHPTGPLTGVDRGPSRPSPAHRWEGTLPGSQGCCMCRLKFRPRGPHARHASHPQVLNGTDQAQCPQQLSKWCFPGGLTWGGPYPSTIPQGRQGLRNSPRARLSTGSLQGSDWAASVYSLQ